MFNLLNKPISLVAFVAVASLVKKSVVKARKPVEDRANRAGQESIEDLTNKSKANAKRSAKALSEYNTSMASTRKRLENLTKKN